MDEMQKQGAALPAEKQPGSATARKRRFWRRAPAILVGTLILFAMLFYGLGFIVESFTHESTDDAFLDNHFVSVAPRIAGQVTKVCVEDNQVVQQGDLLAEIDPRDWQVQLDQKKAAVNAARANVELLQASLGLSQAQVGSAEATAKQTAAEAAAAKATAERAQADLKRAEELIRNTTISPQEFDTAKANAVAAEANSRAAQEKAASDRSKVVEAQAQLEASRKALERGGALMRQAEWDVQAAELNLSYARIVAPESGRVTKKAVQNGDYVQVGQSLMALVPATVWVTANFKETQLHHIRPGQPVRVQIDSVAAGPFSGHVDSIQAGSGARFSLLPPENAVGNYVKVVQRVPVKILFDQTINAGHVLGPGMSVVPSIHVTSYEISEVVILVAAAVLAAAVGALWWRLARRSA